MLETEILPHPLFNFSSVTRGRNVIIAIMVDHWKKVESFTGSLKENAAESQAENLVQEIETSEEPVAPTLRYYELSLWFK